MYSATLDPNGNMRLLTFQGDALTNLVRLDADSVDSLVTDPPSGISFMEKEWDDDKGGRDHWIKWAAEIFKEAFRILKPGAYGLVWALPRTSHWTGTALEDAGFEIRDVITHLFGQGMPKGMNISKALDKEVGVEGTLGGPKSPMHEAWMKRGYVMSEGSNDGYTRDWMKDPQAIDKNAREYIPGSDIAKKWLGWSTTLAPRSENWILVRKPLIGTVAENVVEYGVGGLNIDASRIDYQDEADRASATPQGKCTSKDSSSIGATPDAGRDVERVEFQRPELKGRWPGNAILDDEAAQMLNAQSGNLKSGKPGIRRKAHETTSMSGRLGLDGKQETGYGDSGGASRFFYCAKAPKSDKGAGNDHPTVKHTSLMDYLIRLITPPGGIILDPFMGSGTTGVAALRGGWSFIGIEADEHYYSIATKRLKDLK